MGLPIIVEIAIGLAFIYLVLSLLASEIQELMATILQWRAKHLKDSIVNLFTDDVHSAHSIQKAQKLTKQVYQHPLVQGINQESRGLFPNFFRGITWFISYLYQLFNGKSEGEFNDQRTAPSYISQEAFATALLEQLGTKHFVERLVEAKFSNFIDSINKKVETYLASSDKGLNEYKLFKDQFTEIEDEFIKKNIDLKSAINSISQKLDVFLSESNKITAIDQNALGSLKEWKLRFFIEKGEKLDEEVDEKVDERIDQIIKNFGLKPNLEEIVESIDKGSKIYHAYKEKFRLYEQRRFESVHEDLTLFEKFLNGFLKGLVKEFYSARAAELSKQYLSEIETLDTEFFNISSDESKKKFERTRKPLSEINEIILKKIGSILVDIETIESQHRSAKKIKDSLRAFREGFSGKTDAFNLRNALLFKEEYLANVLSFSLFLIPGILVVLSLLNPYFLGSLSIWFQKILLSRWSGLFFLVLLSLIPILTYRGLNYWFSRRKRELRRKQPSNLAASKPLAGIFDDYFASDEFFSKVGESSEKRITAQDNGQGKTATQGKNLSDQKIEAEILQAHETKFSQEISQRLQQISGDSAQLYSEMKDLGRSFRRYYLRFLLENADIDLIFIPNSVKQSLAVLIRRSKTSAKQAEDQIVYLKEEVESWYDRSMERASGVYKRNAKGISILIGIVLAIAINANSLHILDQLAFEQELRQAVVISAEKIVEQVDASDGLSEEEQKQLYRDTSKLLDDMNLPIGWDPYVVREELNCELTNDESISDDWNTLFKACLYGPGNETAQPPEHFFPPTAIAAILLAHPLVGLKFLLGWILTGIAISMGASFWFDLLSKLVKVRNTGKQLSQSSPVADAQTVTGTSK